MVDKRVVDYLKLGRKKGVPFDVLKKRLLEKGHSAKYIEEAAKEAGIKNYQYKPLAIVSIVILLILFSLIIQNLNKQYKAPTKKTEVPIRQLTQDEQLTLLSNLISEKYKDYKIKNYGYVAYDKDALLRAEVDLGFIDVCNQKVKADSAVFVVQDGKIVPTPVIEIKNKAQKFGEIMPEKIDDTVTEIKKTNSNILYNCKNYTCSTCQLNNIYEIMTKLKSPYTKKIDVNSSFGAGIIRTPPTNQDSTQQIIKLSSPNTKSGLNLSRVMPTRFGDTTVTHKLFVMDEIGNLIYSSEGYENNGVIILLKGEFS